MRAIFHLILKDIKIYFADRTAAIISVGVPVGIAVFLAFVFGGASSGTPKPIEVVVSDSDHTPMSAAILGRLRAEPGLKVVVTTADKGEDMATNGKTAYAVDIPKGFTQAAAASFLNSGPKPELRAFTDPAQGVTVMAARGLVMGAAVNGLIDTVRPGSVKQGEDQLPFKITEIKKQASKGQDDAASKAHVFAGMGLQGVLFYAINLGMGVLKDRQNGIWKRLRAAPITLGSIVAGKVGSGTLTSLITLVAIFAAGMGMGVRVQGSVIGFVLMLVATALMSSTFGLLIASLGKSEEQSRGLSIFVVLTLTMLGGAWFPTFLMPAFMQKITVAIPSRWVVDGFDGVLWRGWGVAEALPALAVILGFATVFFVSANLRFRATEAEG